MWYPVCSLMNASIDLLLATAVILRNIVMLIIGRRNERREWIVILSSKLTYLNLSLIRRLIFRRIDN